MPGNAQVIDAQEQVCSPNPAKGPRSSMCVSTPASHDMTVHMHKYMT